MKKLELSIAFVLFVVIFGHSQARMISHVTTADGGFSTTVVIENTSVVPQTFTLTPYAADGQPLDAVQMDLAAQSVLRSDAHELLGESTSHFYIEAPQDIKVNCFYDFRSGNSSPAFVAESQQQGSIWRLFSGNWDQIFDGVAVVNTGDEPTDVWIAQKDDNNQVLASRRIATALAPNGKALFVVGSPDIREFSNQSALFEISGDQRLAVTALQGTLENDTLNILLASESRPLSQSISKRDDKGIWFIEDGDLYSIFEMMGYNVASDRLWQMESFRRQARGNLGEIISVNQIPNIAEIDSLARRLTFSDAELDAYFENLDSESQIMIRSYVEGVNRRIGQINSDSDLLPVEYKAIGETGAVPWTHRDLMAHLANFQQGFSMRAFGSEQVLNGVLLQDLAAKYGPEQAAVMFNDLRYVSDPQSQTMIAGEGSKTRLGKQDQFMARPREDLYDIREGAYEYVERVNRIRETLKKNGLLIKGGSYAWVVSGSMTDSGNPVLYSGPQVGFSAPVLFVEGSIKSDVLTASGMAIPGIPGIIVGRTPHHAWSMQVSYAGTWDYYLEPETAIRVDRQETITIKDGDELVIDIEVSDHGPIIQELGPFRLAYKYAHRDYNFNLASGVLNLSRAQNMDEFGEAAASLAVSQHLCYVDRDGNIAYWHAGRQPVRPPGDYRVPQGVLAGQPVLEWDAAVVEPLAHERNPAKGYFGGWNNKPEPDFIDYSATTALGPYHRGHAIQDYLQDFDPMNPWTFEDLRDLTIQIGATGNFAAGGNPWTQLGPAVSEALEANPTEERDAVRTMFETWDGFWVEGGPDQWVLGTNINDASVFLEAMIPKLLEKTFDDELGPPTVTQDFLTRFQVFLHGIYEEGLNNSYDWFSNLVDGDAPQTAEAIILQVVDELLVELGDRPWGVGARGTINYPHILFGPITALGVTTPTLHSQRSTYGQCVEFDETGPVRIESYFGLGQSGTITGSLFQPVFDVNALSLKETFDNFVMRPFPLFQ